LLGRKRFWGCPLRRRGFPPNESRKPGTKRLSAFFKKREGPKPQGGFFVWGEVNRGARERIQTLPRTEEALKKRGANTCTLWGKELLRSKGR